jgi:hypothetical protein
VPLGCVGIGLTVDVHLRVIVVRPEPGYVENKITDGSAPSAREIGEESKDSLITLNSAPESAPSITMDTGRSERKQPKSERVAPQADSPAPSDESQLFTVSSQIRL